MVTVKIKATGEIREVTRNIAHDLIDRGIAIIATSKDVFVEKPVIEDKKPETVEAPVDEMVVAEENNYMDRQLHSSRHSK